MTDRERIAELFKIARQEGELRKYADGLADAGELLEILKELGYTRQPEYEPVELEALGDEEIHTIRYPMAQGIIGQHDMCRAISQATIQHNQAKGQLFRLKEAK